MKLRKIILACGALVLESQAWAHAEIFTYEVKGYPRTEMMQCGKTAQEIGERLAAAAQVQIYSARCENETQQEMHIRIDYVAPNEISLVSTSEIFPDIGGQGVYKDKVTCEKNLAAEIQAFESNTRLKPFLAYCWNDELKSRYLPFAVRIDAVGVPVLKPLFFAATLFGTPQGSLEQFSGILRERTGDIVAVDYWSPGLHRLIIRHYGIKESYYSADGERVIFDSAKLCAEQASVLDRNQFQVDPGFLTSFCVDDRMTGTSSELVLLGRLDEEGKRLKFIQTPDRFSTLDACSRQIPKTMDFYRASLGKDISGGICARNYGPFEVVLLERISKS